MIKALFSAVLAMATFETLVAQQYPFLPVAAAPRGALDLFQDSRGRLWLAGKESALFDGSRFFKLSDFGLPETLTYSFAEDSSGAIWVATEAGLYRFFEGSLGQLMKGVVISVVAISPEIAAAAVGEVGKGLPVSTSLVLVRRERGNWKVETVMNLESPGPLIPDHNGMVLYPLPGFGWSELHLNDVATWQPGMAFSAEGNSGGDLGWFCERSGDGRAAAGLE